VRRFHHTGDPVISVDTKKKQLVGSYKNAGYTWRPKGEPEDVLVHDFLDPAVPKAGPLRLLLASVSLRAGRVRVRPARRRQHEGGRIADRNRHSRRVRQGPCVASVV
jgi:hypothetical protein